MHHPTASHGFIWCACAAVVAVGACGDDSGGGGGAAASSGDASSSVAVASSGVSSATSTSSGSSSSSTSAGEGGGGGATSTATSGEGGGLGGDGGHSTTTAGGQGGDGGATSSGEGGGPAGVGGAGGASSGGGEGGATGGGGESASSGGGDGGMSSSASTADVASSSAASTAETTGGGTECVEEPLELGPGTYEASPSSWVDVDGICFNGGAGQLLPFSVSAPKQVTIMRGHHLGADPPFERTALLAGCEDPGLLANADLLLDPAHCRIETTLVDAGTYEFARCKPNNRWKFLVEDPPSAPTNTTCATATTIPGFPGIVEARVVDSQDRYYVATVGAGSLRVALDGELTDAGRATVTITEGCGGPVVLSPSLVNMCTNGAGYTPFVDFAAGTYVIQVNNIEAGSRYRIYLTSST